MQNHVHPSLYEGSVLNRNVQGFVIFLGFLLLNYQNYSVVEMGSSGGIKLYHLFFLGCLPFLVRHIRIDLVLWAPVLLFFFIVFVSSTVASLLNGSINPFLFNYVFAFIAFVVCYGLYSRFRDRVDIIGVLRLAAGVIMIAVLIKLAVFHDSMLSYLQNPMNHPVIFLFYGGGPNLEATWVVMNTAFFSKSRWFWPYWIFALLLAIIYSSRVAFLLAIILPILCFREFRSMRALLGLPLLGALLYFIVMAVSPYMLERFLSIGDEPGSLGRIELWSGGWYALQQLPIIGFGAGNAIYKVFELYGVLGDDNFHNYLMQVLLDFGFPGLMAWLFLLFTIIRNLKRDIAADQLGIFLILFLVASMLQFRGAEALFWSVLGFFIASRHHSSEPAQ